MARTPPPIARHNITESNTRTSNEDIDELEDEEWIDDENNLFTNTANNTPYAFSFHSSLHHFPQERDEISQLIQENGGVVLEEEANADIILADDKSPSFTDLYQRITGTTSQKHVEPLDWVETCVIMGKLRFTRERRSRGGRKHGEKHRPFTVSEQEHIVYYLAHRSPYMPPTQKWQFVPSETDRPYHNHVSRAGNRIWQELCESGRPWARNRSWQGFRGQYTRNQAQYDFWIQCYVEENPWLLNELAERLVEDFADEPGAFEDELAQEEHGRVISRAPNGSPATRNQWPPARVADRTAGTQSRRSPSHPAQAQPNGSQAGIPTARPTVQRALRQAERDHFRSTRGGNESWLINSSDEEDVMAPPNPSHPSQPSSPRIARDLLLAQDNEVEEEEDQQEEAADQEARVSTPQRTSHPHSPPLNHRQYQNSAEDFRQRVMDLQAQNSVPVTARSPQRKSHPTHHPPTSTRVDTSTPFEKARSPSPVPEINQTSLPRHAESSPPTGSTTTIQLIAETATPNPPGGNLQADQHLLLENELLEASDGNHPVPLPVIKKPAGRPRKKQATSAPLSQRNGKQTRQSRKPKGFKIEQVSQTGEVAGPSRQKEIAESVLIYHLAEGGGSIIRRSSKHGTPVRGAARVSSVHEGSPSSRRTSVNSFSPAPFGPFAGARSKRIITPMLVTGGPKADGVPAASSSKRRRTEDVDGQEASVQEKEAQGSSTNLQPHASSAPHSRVSLQEALEMPPRPFREAIRKATLAGETNRLMPKQGEGRRLRSASAASNH
ncbi:hypothetical protein FRC04_000674 [Tulasnella sp. 424]|nr:hypothetical protein FRC04_000674 [Tulasnella sp. 424]KAG8974943.1 hypothetical protein FRC05_006620 [Tulasnella sp. 425]